MSRKVIERERLEEGHIRLKKILANSELYISNSLSNSLSPYLPENLSVAFIFSTPLSYLHVPEEHVPIVISRDTGSSPSNSIVPMAPFGTLLPSTSASYDNSYSIDIVPAGTEEISSVASCLSLSAVKE